jgi:putative RNA 2'-phosphotransferase
MGGFAGGESIVKIDYNQLSKVVSHALRHEPWLYELELDDQGWVDVDHLIEALRKQKIEWQNVGKS